MSWLCLSSLPQLEPLVRSHQRYQFEVDDVIDTAMIQWFLVDDVGGDDMAMFGAIQHNRVGDDDLCLRLVCPVFHTDQLI